MPVTSRKPVTSADFDRKRSKLIKQIADALLISGVAEIPLRQLATKLDTSDRMLLYYFTDKTNLVRLSLSEISARLTETLARFLPTSSSPVKVLNKLVPLFGSAELAPFMRVWADLAARGSRGEEPFAIITRTSVHWWLEWLDQRLDLLPGRTRRDAAAAILTLLEGARFIELFAPGSTKGAMRMLSRNIGKERKGH